MVTFTHTGVSCTLLDYTTMKVTCAIATCEISQCDAWSPEAFNTFEYLKELSNSFTYYIENNDNFQLKVHITAIFCIPVRLQQCTICVYFRCPELKMPQIPAIKNKK